MLPTFPWTLSVQARDAAQAMGADALWTADHFLGMWHPEVWRDVPLAARRPDPDAYMDPFCVCAALAPTTDLPLGLAVTDAVRRRAPDLARTALTLQQICKGGFNLGIGAGESANLLPFGYPFDRPVAELEACLRLLRHVLDTGRMPQGPGRIALPLVSAAGKPRVWVAGQGPRTLRLTGQYADGWLASRTMTMSPEEYGRRRAIVAAQARAAGRPEPEAGLGVFILLGENRARIREMFDAQPLGKLFALVMRPEWFRQHGLEHPVAAAERGAVDLIVHTLDSADLRRLAPTIRFEVLAGAILMGNSDEIADELRAYAEQGCEHVMLINMTGLVGGLEEIAAQAPRLRILRQQLAAIRARPEPSLAVD